MSAGAVQPPSTAPEAPSPTTRRLVPIAAGVALFALAVVLPLLRQQGEHSWNTWLLDDLYFYYGQADVGSSPELLFRAYTSGYLQFLPRLLALVAQVVPVERAAAFHAVAGAVVTALVAWFTYHVTRGWISSRPIRLTLAALIVLMPAAGIENSGTTVYTVWAFAAATPWAIVSLEEKNRDVVLRSIVVFLAATGLPVPFLFAPLALGWVWYRRSRAAVIVASSFAVGLALQALIMVVTDSQQLGPTERPASEIAELITNRSFGVYLAGSRGAVDLWRDHGLTPGVIAGIVLTAIFCVTLVGVRRRTQVLAVIFYGYGLLTLFALVWWRGTTPWRFRDLPFDIGAQMRYSVPTTLFFASALALTLAPTDRVARDRIIARVGRPLFIAHVAIVTVLSFNVTSYRSIEEPWPETVATAREQCAAAASDTPAPEAGEPTSAAGEILCRKLGY